jgi:hypothetical protein
MKLCQKCKDAVGEAYWSFMGWNDLDKKVYNNSRNWGPDHVVPESECEFWSHKELNRINKARVESYNDDFKKQGRMGIGPID